MKQYGDLGQFEPTEYVGIRRWHVRAATFTLQSAASKRARQLRNVSTDIGGIPVCRRTCNGPTPACLALTGCDEAFRQQAERDSRSTCAVFPLVHQYPIYTTAHGPLSPEHGKRVIPNTPLVVFLGPVSEVLKKGATNHLGSRHRCWLVLVPTTRREQWNSKQPMDGESSCGALRWK